MVALVATAPTLLVSTAFAQDPSAFKSQGKCQNDPTIESAYGDSNQVAHVICKQFHGKNK